MRDGLINAKSYHSETMAAMDQKRLEAAGIESWVQADNCEGMLPQMDLVRSVKLLVHKEDETAARELLSHQASSPVEYPWVCPGCHELIEAGFDTCWNCGVAHTP